MSQPQPEPQVSPVTEPAQPAQPSEAGPSTAPPHPASHQPTTTTTTTPPAPAFTRAEDAPTHPAINQTPTASTLVAHNNEPETFYDKLNGGDRQWKWKIGMRAIIIVVSFIGLGCAAWVVATFTNTAQYRYFDYDNWDQDIFPWVLITFPISILWCTICVWFFLANTKHSQIHPGAQVGVDLIMWLAYIGTGLCAVAGVLSVAQFGNDGTLDSGWSSRDGRWDYQQSNNSWVYNTSSSSSSSSYSSDYPFYGSSSSSSSSSSVRSCTSSPFTSCAEMDAYVNRLWQSKGARFNSELTATVCQFIALFLHFVLFVWACVDTHRKRHGRVGKDAEKLAAEIVQKMIDNGAVIPPPGQARMQPMAPPQQQFYPQQYPQYPQYQPYQQFAPQPVPQASQAPSTNAQAPTSSSGKIPPHEQPTLVSQTRSEKGHRFA